MCGRSLSAGVGWRTLCFLQQGMNRTLFSLGLVGLGVAALGGFENGDGVPQPPAKEWAARNEALTRARVFRETSFNAASIDFAADPNRGIVDKTLTTCRYKPDEVSGTTPKFDCELPSGEKIKVKYGGTQEIPSETAATRLLHALGFGADRVSRVDAVRCYGCPFQPFHTRALLEMLNLEKFVDKRTDYSSYRDFTQVSVERNLEGEAIEVGHERGWAFYELKKIDPVARRRHACRGRCAQAHGCVSAPLGQQVVESAVDVPGLEDGGLQAPARHDSGRGF